jgi:hypothetical protein
MPCATSRCTQFADASAATIRLKLLKLGARVRISVCRVYFAITSSCPNRGEFEAAYRFFKLVGSGVNDGPLIEVINGGLMRSLSTCLDATRI